MVIVARAAVLAAVWTATSRPASQGSRAHKSWAGPDHDLDAGLRTVWIGGVPSVA